MSRLFSFIVFLTVFFTLYGSLHFYLYTKLRKAFEITSACNGVLIVVLCFLLFSPILMHVSANTRQSSLTQVLGYVAFLWMGGLFLFFSANILVDVYGLLIHLLSRVASPALARLIPGDTATFVVTSLLVAGIVLYGNFEGSNIRVEKIGFKTAKLPPSVKTLRVVQISDTHFSPLMGAKFAEKIRWIIEQCHPDILVSTGDLLDSGVQDEEGVASVFRGIKTTYGKYAIAGNHEFISGIRWAEQFIEKAGFKMLRNEQVAVGDFLVIAGVDDSAARRSGVHSAALEAKLLESNSPDHLTILLKHQPLLRKNSIGRFDVQLSGHTHSGQIFPFTYLSSLLYPKQKGHFDLGGGSYLYVSRGTGTWGPPIRFLASPEITVIDFQSSTDQSSSNILISLDA